MGGEDGRGAAAETAVVGLGVRRIDRITAVVLLCVAAFVTLYSLQWPLFAEYGPGVGFLPFILGIMLAVMALSLLAKATLGPKSKDSTSSFPRGRAARTVLFAILGLGLGCAALEPLGYLPAVLLLVAYLMTVVLREKPKTAALTTAGVTFFVWIVFKFLLGINLPTGLLGF